MPVPFGFSCSDFIAVLRLLKTIVEALRDSHGAKAEFRELTTQLLHLDTVLNTVNDLDLDHCSVAQRLALEQLATRCRSTIELFWIEKIQKFQPSLQDCGSGQWIKDAWRKIKWSLCRPEDVEKFTAALLGHIVSITAVLTVIQIHAGKKMAQDQQTESQSLVRMVQEGTAQQVRLLCAICNAIAASLQQSKEPIQSVAGIVASNIKIYKTVLEIHEIVLSVPKMVPQSSMVTFIDAFNRVYPIPLDLITSAEALTAVLKVQFKKFGPELIDNGWFNLEDAHSKRLIDLGLPWTTCFQQGQTIRMSIDLLDDGSHGSSGPMFRRTIRSHRR